MLISKWKSPLKLAALLALGFLTIAVLTAARPGILLQEADACLECHKDLAPAYAAERHSVAGHTDCALCHGDPSQHLEDGGGKGNILALNDLEKPIVKSKQCLTCHTQSNPRYLTGPHGQSSMDCMTCHSIHGNSKSSLLKSHATKTCSVCHGDVFSQFQLNERHRLQEGIMSCATCHDPHEPSTGHLMGGFKDESCLQCHTEKGGPFLYEHQASRLEGCGSCHEVHGTPNRHMLKMQSVSDLCFSCHAAAPSWHSRFTSEGTNCSVCHSTIHGSNLSRIFLK